MVIAGSRCFATAVALATGVVLVAAPAASGDTARLVLDQKTAHGGPTRASVVITSVDGSTRWLGPRLFAARPGGLRRSPDGRYFAAPLGSPGDRGFGIAIVPTDGSVPFVIVPRSSDGNSHYIYPASISWSSDSRELLLGNIQDDRKGVPGEVARCSVVRRRCAVVPNVRGFATALPGAIVTSTSSRDLVDWVSHYAMVDPYGRPADRPTRRALQRRRLAQTARVTSPGTRVLLRRRATVLNGIDAATGMVGGPSHALIAVDRFRLRQVQRRGRTFVRSDGQTRRWVLVGSRGPATTVPARRLFVPRAHGALVEDDDLNFRVHAQRKYPEPRAPIATGGWLAVTGSSPSAPGRSGLVLTTITPRGRASFVRAGDQIASAAQLVRSVLARRKTYRGTAALEVVGHEAATNAAIVDLSWDEPDPLPGDTVPQTVPGTNGIVPAEDSALRRHTTVRVPLDGRTPPSVVSGTTEDEAW